MPFQLWKDIFKPRVVYLVSSLILTIRQLGRLLKIIQDAQEIIV